MKKLWYILVFCFLIAAGTIVMTGCEKKPSGAIVNVIINKDKKDSKSGAFIVKECVNKITTAP